MLYVTDLGEALGQLEDVRILPLILLELNCTDSISTV